MAPVRQPVSRYLERRSQFRVSSSQPITVGCPPIGRCHSGMADMVMAYALEREMGLVGSLNRGAVQGGFLRVSVLVLVGLQMMGLPLALLINGVEGLPMQLALGVLLLSGGVVRKGLVRRVKSGDSIRGWEGC